VKREKKWAFGYTHARAGEEELLVLLLVAAASFALNSCGSTTVAGVLLPACEEKANLLNLLLGRV